MKHQEALKRAQSATPTPIKKQGPEGTGSAWNTNNFHWEEKSVGKWSRDTMQSILTNFHIKQDVYSLKITEVKELRGEAGISIRRGQKIVTYDFRIFACWRLECSDGTATAVAEGFYALPEVSFDEDWNDWMITTTMKSDMEEVMSIEETDNFVKKHCAQELRK